MEIIPPDYRAIRIIGSKSKIKVDCSELWKIVDEFNKDHIDDFAITPSLRTNVRYRIEAIAEPLISQLQNLQLPYLRDQNINDITNYYYYIISLGKKHFESLMKSKETHMIKSIWDAKLHIQLE
jgi:hypothetical protein